jgi:hypothetical protein
VRLGDRNKENGHVSHSHCRWMSIILHTDDNFPAIVEATFMTKDIYYKLKVKRNRTLLLHQNILVVDKENSVIGRQSHSCFTFVHIDRDKPNPVEVIMRVQLSHR